MDVKQHWNIASELRSCVKVEVAVLGSPSVIVLMVSVDVKQYWNIGSELRSCVKIEVAVLGSPSVIVLMVSVDVKQHWNIASEQCGSRGGRPDTATVLYGL